MTMRAIIMVGAAWAAVLSGMASEPADKGLALLRVFRVQPDTFDYILTSYVQADGTWIVSLNHRGGQTHFVQPGQMIGRYRLVDFEPAEEAVFVPSIKATQVRKTGRATLENGEGRAYTLTMGQQLEIPGRRAVIASLKSGVTWSVRVGDTVRFAEGMMTIVDIAQDGPVAVRVADVSAAIPMAKSDEVLRLADLMQRQEKAKQIQEHKASEWKADTKPDEVDGTGGFSRPHPPRAWPPLRPVWEPGWFFGTETHYPAACELWRRPDGSWIRVPRAFESRRIGVGGGHYSDTEPRAPYKRRSPSVREVVPPYASPMTPHPEDRR